MGVPRCPSNPPVLMTFRYYHLWSIFNHLFLVPIIFPITYLSCKQSFSYFRQGYKMEWTCDAISLNNCEVSFCQEYWHCVLTFPKYPINHKVISSRQSVIYTKWEGSILNFSPVYQGNTTNVTETSCYSTPLCNVEYRAIGTRTTSWSLSMNSL